MKNFDLTDQHQRVLLSALLRTPEFTLTYRYVIKPEYFSGEAMVIICGALFAYIDQYGGLPKPSTLADKISHEARKYLDDEMAETCLTVLKDLYHVTIRDLDYLGDRVREFARDAEWRSLLIEAPDLIDNGNYDELFDRASVAHECGFAEAPYSLTGEKDARLSRILEIAEGGTIPMGIKYCDEHIRIYPPACCMVMGESSAGKTWFGAHICRISMLNGYNVAYFTGEMTTDEIAIRIDGGILAINTSWFFVPSAHEKISMELDKRYPKYKGHMTIKEFQAKAYSVQMLELDIRRMLLEPETAPKVVVVDYLELLTFRGSDQRKMQGWEELTNIAMALKGIANKYKIVLWVVGTVSGEEDSQSKLMTRLNKGMSKSTIYAPDYNLTLNRNQEDKEKNMIRLYWDKARHLRDQLIVGIVPDFEHSRFCVKSLGYKYRSDLTGGKSD